MHASGKIVHEPGIHGADQAMALCCSHPDSITVLQQPQPLEGREVGADGQPSRLSESILQVRAGLSSYLPG